MQIFRLWWVTNVFDLFFRDHLRLLEGPWTCDDHLQQNTTFGGQPDILLMFLHTLKTQNNNTGGKPSPNKNYQLNHSNLVVAQTPTSNRELPFKESNLCVFYDLSFLPNMPLRNRFLSNFFWGGTISFPSKPLTLRNANSSFWSFCRSAEGCWPFPRMNFNIVVVVVVPSAAPTPSSRAGSSCSLPALLSCAALLNLFFLPRGK